MAKKPTRKASRRRAAPHQQETIFDVLARHQPGGGDPARLSEPKDEIAELKAQIAELKGIIQGSRIAGQPAKKRKPELPLDRLNTLRQELANLPKIDMDTGLPDPATDFEAHMRERDRRAAAKAEVDRKRQQIEADMAQLRQSLPKLLMEQFEAAYPEYKGKPRQIKAAMHLAFEEATEKGLQPEQYADTEALFDDMASILEDLGGPKGKKRKANGHREDDWEDFVEDDEDADFEDDDEDEDSDADADAGRTEGIFGGLESGGKPSRGRSQVENPNEFIDDIKQIQMKLGIV